MAIELEYQKAPRRRRRFILRILVAAILLTFILVAYLRRGPVIAWYTLRQQEYQCCHYITDPARPVATVPPVLLSYLDRLHAVHWMHIEPTEHLVFLHERLMPTGTRKLVVCIGEYLTTTSTTPPFVLVIRMETVDIRTHSIDWSQEYNILLNRSTTNILFGGQADPADPSHFEFKYAQDKGSGTVDVRLSEEKYKRMKVNVRDGPAADLQWHLDGG